MASATSSPARPDKDSVKKQFAQHVSSGKVRFFEQAGIDFVLGAREGPYLWDLSGEKRLIDCHCNGGVFNLGHRHPAILQALTDAAESFDIGNHHLISAARSALAARLAELAPGKMPYAVFGSGGGEAIDLAIKIARGFTGREQVLSARGGYHGHTGLALAAGDERYRAPFGLAAPGFVQIPFNDVAALETALQIKSAAVLLETVPATDGIVVPEPSYFSAVRSLCDRSGALLIVDEIQSGLGRTGKLWALEHFSVEPDILVTGKGLSGGVYPIAATCFRGELERVFHPDPFIHVSTFGGAELGCMVAMQMLEITSDQAFLGHVNSLAAIFQHGLSELKRNYPETLLGVRQLGLMIGLELPDRRYGPAFSKYAFEAGFLSVFANNNPSVAQFLPPLNLESSLAEELLTRVDQALAGVAALDMAG